MRYIKMLGLVAVAAAAMLAFAAAASATTIMSSGSPYTGKIAAEILGGGVQLHGVETFTCQTSVGEGTVEEHGSSITAKGKVSGWDLTDCNSNVDLAVFKTGELEVHATSKGNATVTSSGVEIQVTNTSMGLTCIFTTTNTHIGTLKGNESNNARLELESAEVPRTGGSIFCGSSGEITGEYEITTPSSLYVQ